MLLLKRFILCSLLLLPDLLSARGTFDETDLAAGEALYNQHCLFCHGGSVPEAPGVAALELFPPERIVDSLTSGVMSTAGLPLSAFEMRQVAYYLTGRTVTASETASYQRCESEQPYPASETASGRWADWGAGPGNARHQHAETILRAEKVGSLELAWSFAFPDATRVRSQPTVAGNVAYIGSQDGTVYALDAASGCVHWTFQAASEVRGAPVVAATPQSELLLFGDFKGYAYALDRRDGSLRWKRAVHDHPLATITGSLAADTRHAYVPISSSEVVPAGQSTYPCCTFRGALVALDISNGEPVWTYFTTPAPSPRGKSSAGTPQFGPSGAPVWSSPTIDARRDLVILTTGQNYSSPATATSDAVIALDASTGRQRWVTQVTANDAWNGACVRSTPNCPQENGPDFDLGASAVLVTLDTGRDLLFAGQKSGLVYALDPAREGALLWTRRVGSGGTMGGVHWGMSSDGQRLYVGVSDQPTNNRFTEGPPQPGVHALDPITGEILWRNVLQNRCESGLRFLCWPGVSAAVSSSPGVVYAGSLDGTLRALDAKSGDTLWEHNTRRDYDTVGGARGKGGAIEADGPVIAGGRLYVTSGYDKWGEFPGNVLLVFALPAQ